MERRIEPRSDLVGMTRMTNRRQRVRCSRCQPPVVVVVVVVARLERFASVHRRRPAHPVVSSPRCLCQ